MQALNTTDFNELDVRAIAQRIDTFFDEDLMNRYGNNKPIFDVSAIAIYKSAAIQSLEDNDKKNALLLFYRAHFQIALCFQYSALENKLIHDINDTSKWLKPNLQVLAASTRQAGIIASKIAFECLMEFVYFAENKQLIPSKKSKLNSFRKWLCRPRNKFGWLIFYLFMIYRFDKNHRTPEIHGTSYIAIDALCCKEWPRQNTEYDITNLMLNIWRSILETLNGGLNISCFSGSDDEDLFKDFFQWRKIDLETFWRKNIQTFTNR